MRAALILTAEALAFVAFTAGVSGAVLILGSLI